MLSGIRTGKAKKKKAKKEQGPPRSTDDTTANANANADANANAARKSGGGSSISSSDKIKSKAANLSVAEKLKQALASGVPFQDGGGSSNSNSSSRTPSSKSYMERVVGGTSAAPSGNDNYNYNDDSANDTVIVLGAPGTTAAHNHKREEDMTVAELAARERSTGRDHSMSWNEHMARNIVRVGKKRKIKQRTAAAVDSDEEVEQMKKHLPDYHRNDNAESTRRNAKHLEKEDLRDRRRQIDRYQKQEKITSMCSWWIQSSSFARHRLLAFGKHVALMMAPPNASLVPGHQFYLVPLKHAPSMVECDDPGVRDELGLFRTSLENMYALQGKGLVLCETVLPNKNLWQTRVEVVPVPFAKLGDAPLFFRSAMAEQAEEFGTHMKLLPTTLQKPLRSVLPKRFPYFCVDWGNLATARNGTTGCAQLIESSGFPKDFGLDTMAGMMELDPVRFRRKERFPNGFEARLVAEFGEMWKAVDWTQKLED